MQRRIDLHERAGAYLLCSQRIKRQYKRPANERISGARPAIERFSCNGKDQNKR